jgi:hypothetical protein
VIFRPQEEAVVVLAGIGDRPDRDAPVMRVGNEAALNEVGQGVCIGALDDRVAAVVPDAEDAGITLEAAELGAL